MMELDSKNPKNNDHLFAEFMSEVAPDLPPLPLTMHDWRAAFESAMEKRFYILEMRAVVPVSFAEWAAWFETSEERFLCADLLRPRGALVSTVFLGLNHNHDKHAEPLLFETLIHGGKLSGLIVRYSSYDEALFGHRCIVEMLLPRERVPRRWRRRILARIEAREVRRTEKELQQIYEELEAQHANYFADYGRMSAM